jgi:hypothetical protein
MHENAATDAGGHFRFEGLAPGRYMLEVYGGMGVPPVTKEVLVADRDLLGVELRIEDAGWLRVKVVDESGSPVAGVTVFEEEGCLFARSGEDGVAVLENLPPRKRVHLTAQGGTEWGNWKYVNLRVPEPTLPDGGEATLVVARADPVRGIVLDEDGSPMQGAIVSTGSHYAFTTRADGTFRLSVPQGATVDLVAHLNPVDPVRRAGAKGVKAPAEGIVLRMKTIPKTGTLTFRLLDASGLPVPLFDLKVYAGEERTVRTDDAGRATLEGLVADETQFFAWIPPQGPDDPWPLPGGAVVPPAVSVVPDGREVDFRLLPGEEIRGTVLDPGGKPAKGARVFAFRAGKWMSTEGLTDDGGRYRIMVPAGEILPSIRAILRKDAATSLHAFATDVRPGTKELLLRLEED